MALSTALAQHRKKLASASPVLALQGCAGVTHTLSTSPAALGSEGGNQAIAACLGHELREVVEEACRWLLAASVSWAQTQDLLLGALAASGPRSSAVLAQALCQAYCNHALSPGTAGGQPVAWAQHPLSSALLLNSAIASQLLSSCCSALYNEAACTGNRGILSPRAAQLWLSLEPFFLFVLLQKGVPLSGLPSASAASYSASTASSLSTTAPAASTWALLPELLQQQLVRLACRSPPLALPVTRLLIQALTCSPLSSDTERARALQSVDAVMDLVETLVSAPTQQQHTGLAALAPHAYRALLLLAHELRAVGGDSLAVILRALQRLHQLTGQLQLAPEAQQALQAQGVWAADVRHQASCLALLLQGATVQEQEQLHVLLHQVLEEQPDETPHLVPDCALSQLQLLCCLAYGTSTKAKQWSSHLLRVMEDGLQFTPLPTSSALSHTWAATSTWHGDLRLLQQARGLLQSAGYASPPAPEFAVDLPSWGEATPQPLRRWLLSLACQLHLLRTSQQSGGDTASKGDLPASAMGGTALTVPLAPSRDLLPGRQAPEQPELGPAAEAVLAAALLCPDPATRSAAAAAAQQLLLLRPLTSLRLLPLLLRSSSRCSHPIQAHVPPRQWQQQEAAAQLSLLQLLPAMALDTSVAPLAARALAPLQAEGAPLLLRCLALRLTVQGWLLTGRGWARVEAAINGYAPQDRAALPPLQLRVTRAALIRSVVQHDPFKGLELVCALQEAVLDPSPCVSALGLHAMTVMCETDVLDFYKAWQVVQRHYPALPSHPLLASAWVGLLAGGALDAEAYPDRARAVLQALWAATRHPQEQVRREAYRALSAYPLELVEKLEHDEGADQAEEEEAGQAMIEAIDLEGYVRPLAGTAGGGAGAAAPAEPGASALQAAEGLACLALQHEHNNRRRFLAAAAAAAPTPGSAGGGAGGAGDATGAGQGQGRTGTAAAAAAAAREAAALRHRLGSTLPSALQQPNGQFGLAAAASPGPGLLLYRGPPPGPASSAQARAGKAPAQQQQQQQQQQQRVHAGFALRLREALGRSVSWLSWPYTGQLLLRSWQTLFTRWIQESDGNIDAIWAELVAQWGCGEALSTPSTSGPSATSPPLPPSASVLTAAPLAAAALAAACAAGVEAGSVNATSCSRHIDWALGQVLLQLQPEQQRPRAVLLSCACATATLASLLHPTDQASRARALAALQRLYSDDLGQGDAVRGVAALSIAALAASAASELPGWSQPPSLEQQQQQQGGGAHAAEGPAAMLKSALGLLLGGLAAQSPSWCSTTLAAAAQQIAASAPPLLQPLLVTPTQPSRGASTAAAARLGATPGPGGRREEEEEEEDDDGQAQLLQGLLSGLCLLLATQAAPRAAHGGGQPTAPLLLPLLHSAVSAAATQGAGALGLSIPAVPGAPEGKPAVASTPTSGAALARQLAALLGCLPFTLSPPHTAGLAGLSQQQQQEQQALACTLLRGFATAPGVDGLVQGAAAQALATATALQASSAAVNVAPAAAATAAQHVLSAPGGVLELLLGLSKQELKGSHASGTRMGALAGLSVLLLGSASALSRPPGAAVLGPADTAASSGGAATAAPGLLSHADDASKAVRAAIKALEAAASSTGIDSRAAGAAAWMLAELCERYAVRSVAEAAASALSGEAGAAAAAGGRAGQAAAAGSGRLAAVAAGRLIPLASYPAAGAHRPLTDAVAAAATGTLVAAAAKGGDAAASAAVAAVAAALRCLAASPRLPAWDWGSACRRLWTQAEAALPMGGAADTAPANGLQGVVQLQEAVLGLILTHGGEPGHGLATLLDDLVAGVPRGSGLAQAHPRVQALFLRRLPQAASCLAASRGDVLLGALLPLLQQLHLLPGSGTGRSSNDPDGDCIAHNGAGAAGSAEQAGPGWGLTLLGAAWEGLAGILRHAASSGGRQSAPVVSGALRAVLGSMLQLLPSLPPLLPGEVAWASSQLRPGAALEPLGPSSPDAASEALQEPAGRQQQAGMVVGAQPSVSPQPRFCLAVWCRAAAALVAAGAHTATVLLDSTQQPGSGVAALRMRCLLALAGLLSYRDLAPCRSAYLQLSEGDADALACLLAEALATAPEAAQVQMVQEALESAHAASQPHRALALAAVLIAAWQAQGQGAAGAVAEQVCLVSNSSSSGSGCSVSRWAVDCLPASLPALLRLPQWAPSLPSVTALLLQLLERGMAVQEQDRHALLATLLALRLQVDARPELAGAGRGTGAEVYRMLAKQSGMLVPAV